MTATATNALDTLTAAGVRRGDHVGLVIVDGAGLALALRNELPANDSGVRARGKESDIAADSGGLRNSSPEGLAGLFGGAGLSLRSASDDSSTIDST